MNDVITLTAPNGYKIKATSAEFALAIWSVLSPEQQQRVVAILDQARAEDLAKRMMNGAALKTG